MGIYEQRTCIWTLLFLLIEAGVVSLLVSLPNSWRDAAPPSEDSTQIHKHTQHITADFKVAAHIYHSEYASVNEGCLLVTLKYNENEENMKFEVGTRPSTLLQQKSKIIESADGGVAAHLHLFGKETSGDTTPAAGEPLLSNAPLAHSKYHFLINRSVS